MVHNLLEAPCSQHSLVLFSDGNLGGYKHISKMYCKCIMGFCSETTGRDGMSCYDVMECSDTPTN